MPVTVRISAALREPVVMQAAAVKLKKLAGLLSARLAKCAEMAFWAQRVLLGSVLVPAVPRVLAVTADWVATER